MPSGRLWLLSSVRTRRYRQVSTIFWSLGETTSSVGDAWLFCCCNESARVVTIMRMRVDQYPKLEVGAIGKLCQDMHPKQPRPQLQSSSLIPVSHRSLQCKISSIEINFQDNTFKNNWIKSDLSMTLLCIRPQLWRRCPSEGYLSKVPSGQPMKMCLSIFGLEPWRLR